MMSRFGVSGEGPLGFLGGYLVGALVKDFISPTICFFF